MSSKIQIIKTLPHLIPLFISKEEAFVYSDIYSDSIIRFFESLQIWTLKEITFQKIANYLSSSSNLNSATLKVDDNLSNNSLSYEKVNEITEKLQFSIKGDTISFWPIGYDHPIRLEFFGNDLEKIYSYDELYNRRIKYLNQLYLSNYILDEKLEQDSIKISAEINISKSFSKYIFVNSINDLKESNTIKLINSDFQYPHLFYHNFALLEKEIQSLERNNYQILIKTKNKNDLFKLLKGYTNKTIAKVKIYDFVSKSFVRNLNSKHLDAGFISEKLKIAIFTDRELFGAIYLTRPERIKKVTSNLKKLLKQFEGSIQIGDYVVHEDYGIGIYSGLKQEIVNNESLEYLSIKYADDDELFVPIHQIEKITKYIGTEGREPRITRLGKVSWEHLKSKIKKSTELLARDLIEHFAKREISEANPVSNSDTKDYKQFVDEFKYIETEDQLNSINEVLSDLTKDKPMNRLLVGDVGFGKTEVFMRAAFKIVEDGGQVAVLSPTTILTAQHYAVFEERFKSFPFRIEYLSRFNSTEKNKKIIEDVNNGIVDIVIGTHRLLSSDVKFKNLQLVVVDEEQRFGVKQKEKIKQLNYGVHLLSVSATPIPRTLSMALSSIQDISIISQPPKERKPIHTEIIHEDYNKITEAINFEVKRGGQVYFLHNEVQSINQMKLKLNNLMPGIRFTIAHGQMRSDELDKVMTEFYKGKYDCLICSTIIENGLDLPNVNTIIINNSQRFGLSQLYQLRGRVGRSTKSGYCYLISPRKSSVDFVDNKEGKIIQKKYIDRLQTLVDNQDLGAGFRIASRDLEIRGAGNLLGEEQSGYISTIGYALYIQILAEEVERLKNLKSIIN